MNERLKIIFICSFLSAFSFAENPPVLSTCFGCHGPAGVSGNQVWPNLAGQKKDYLIKQLRAFRSEERKDAMMNPMAKPLTDGEIEKLAQYFSELKP